MKKSLDYKDIIIHVCTKIDLEKVKESGKYYSGNLISNGYIHCSEVNTILRVANSKWIGRKDLILLFINKNKVKSEIKFELDINSGVLYPHIYGLLNLDAIVLVKDFLPKNDGLFDESSIYN